MFYVPQYFRFRLIKMHVLLQNVLCLKAALEMAARLRF